ncbi:hypothetical protein G195_011224, partial [Phytophthora kernoviae 00238/432]
MAAQATTPVEDQVVLTPTNLDSSTLKYDLQEDQPEEENTYQKKTLKEKITSGIMYTVASLAALYFFMVAVKFIGDGFTLALGCDSKGAFDFANNPVAGLMIGTISTALLHSSGTVTSITVALVGAGGMTVRQGVYVVMGANIGTCVTCIMVAFGQVGDPTRFQRAMAAATVHDMYNIWSVIVLFPIEVLFHPLEKMSVAMSNAKTSSGAFDSPVDAIVKPLTQELLVVDKKSIYKVATGDLECTSNLTFVSGGVFEGSSMSDGSIGAITVVVGFCILVCALVTLVKMLAKVFLGPTKTLVSKLLNYNGYVNIFVGTLITFAVHSSTVVTSTLTPMAGLGVITLEQVYPLVIGANLGTTGTALLASLVTGKADSVAIALVHFWFNVFGIILFYPIPITRKPILDWARSLAFFSASWAWTAALFLIFLFLVIPGILLGLVYMCTADSTVWQVFGWVITCIVVLFFCGVWFWYKKKGGKEVWYAFLERKRIAREQRKAGEDQERKSFVGEDAVSIMSMLLPEPNIETSAEEAKDIPDVYHSLHFRSLQEPYNHSSHDTTASRYSTLDADNLEAMLNGGLERFYKKYHYLSRKINLQLPTPEVRFQDLSFAVQVPATAGSHNTVGSYLGKIFTPWKKPQLVTKQALHPMTGIIKPGSMTLILANPGAGKSTFLKALAGKLQNNSKTEIGGEILYSGLRDEEIDLIKLVGLVDQTDNHIPTLTVRETFKFADLCVNGRPEDQPEGMRDIAALRTELFLQILGLENCADTVVGNALLRGLSGGERKRVTVGEVLVGGQSLFLCDEISTGLDSAATFDIIKSLRTWCKTLGGSVIVALLQPTPEVVEQFDDILMINEGHMVYHGPRTEILDYFEERGFSCPPRVDPADFLIEVVSGRGQRYANNVVEKNALPLSSEDFNNLFCQSNIFKKTSEDFRKDFNEHQFEKPEDFKNAKSVMNLARSKDASEFGLAFIPSTLLLLNRQKLIWLRDPPLLWGKLIESLIIGLVMGMIYYDVDSKYYLRMIFFSIALFQRQAWQQITISFQLRKVFYKQRARNFFRTTSYAIAESVVQIPVNVAVSFILGTFFYFMSGLTRSFEKFIVFYLVLLCFQHAISAYMTMLSALSPSITIGQALASISVSFFLLFSGNIILADLIPDYWIWMYWFSPISWALRSNMLSEFSSDRYTAVQSRKLLDSFSISQGTEYIWFGVGILLAYYLFFTTLNGLALHFIRYEKYQGVSAKTLAGNVANDNVYVEVNTPGEHQKSVKGEGLPFTPSNLCIKDLEYYVTLPSGEEKQLLN